MAIRSSSNTVESVQTDADQAPKGSPDANPVGARGLQSRIGSEFARPADDQERGRTPDSAKSGESLKENAQKAPAKSTGSFKSKLLKSIFGLALVITVGFMPVKRLLETSSVQAVVNAPIVTLRAPIAGVVGGNISDLVVGQDLKNGQPLVHLVNYRTDPTEMERAAEQVSGLSSELLAVRARIADLEKQRIATNTRLQSYTEDRALRLERQLAGADARIVELRAERGIIEAGGMPFSAFVGTGQKARSSHMKLELEAADARIAQAEASRDVIWTELQALEAGRYLGDDYNDVPRSAQRIDEIDDRLIELRADENRLEQRLGQSKSALAAETDFHDASRQAYLNAPVGGRVWEILTSPGEQVVVGQHLVSLVDCSKLIVTAAVSESVYNFLSVGWNVRFLLDGSNVELPGKVVNLSGVASAASNYAIDPAALTKEAYRVSVAVDSTALDGACALGRTGRVIFKNS